MLPTALSGRTASRPYPTSKPVAALLEGERDQDTVVLPLLAEPPAVVRDIQREKASSDFSLERSAP